MLLHESIICSTGLSSSNPGHGSITLHDIQTGSTLASFKHTTAELHCTAIVETKQAQGGFILAAQPDKSILNVYNFQKDQISLKTVLPEKLTCLALDKSGDYCAGGTANGRIFLWEVASGILFNAWDAHYRRVNVLRFTHDGAALLSGSEDSGVSVWSISRLLDDELQNELPAPYCMLSDHTLPVTDIVCGIGAFSSCRVLTASIDHSVKLWDLASRSLLTTFLFPHPITCLAFEVTERTFFAASSDGSIHQVRLFRRRETQNGRLGMEALGGAGSADAIRFDTEQSDGTTKRLITVGQPVTTVAISLTSTLLLAGTATGHIHVYDIASHQLLRSISTHKGLPITHLATMLKPPDLIGHVSLSLAGNSLSMKDAIPPKPVAAFQRIRDGKSREKHEVAMMLPVHLDDHIDPFTYSDSELHKDHQFFAQLRSTTAGATATSTGSSLQCRVSDLEAEVMKLREQLGKAKGVNDVMWETVVHKLIVEKKDESKQSVENEDVSSEPLRKRGRV